MLSQKLAPIEISAFKRHDKCLTGRDIGRNWDVVNVAESQKIMLIRFGGLTGQGIAEEDQKVDLVAGDLRADLLTSTLRACEILLDA